MAASLYTVMLYDIRTQKIFAKIPKAELSYEYEMDDAGSASISVPMKAKKLDGTRLTPYDLFPCRTGVAIQRGSELVWGGLIWQYQVDLSTQLISIDAGGYLSYYKYRHTNVKGNKFKNKETIDIVKWFILETNSGSTAGNGINTNISGLKPVGTLKTKTWNPFEYESLDSVIIDMADEIASYDPNTLKYGGGFFFYFEPYFIDSDRIGHRMSNTESRHPLFNGITLRQSVNCEFSNISVDGNSMANVAYVVGAGNGEPSITPHAELKNTIFSQEIPYMNTVVSATGDKNPASLRWRARSALAYGSIPITLPTADTFPNMFSPLQFKPGMLVKVTTDDGFLSLTNAEYVVTKVSVSMGTDGSDRLSIDMIQSALFTEVPEEDEEDVNG
ncbi:hypothetical protein ACFC1L_40115 [Streptomyces sp. NPDC056210]|uniref:hypothetical protein n=1 Tax=Streptomyces sp. NPDC056210 TaxID=3345746 RepID=UPI0035E39040